MLGFDQLKPYTMYLCDRQRVSNLLAMDALKFGRDRLLICGSDAPGDQPAIVQIWDIDARVNVSTYPAHDTVSILIFGMVCQLHVRPKSSD